MSMIRRIVILATGTIGGVGVVLSYHPPQLHPVAAIGTATPPSPSATPTQTSGATGATSTPTMKPIPAKTPKPVTGKTGNFVGDNVRTPYGPVQVRITVNAGTITAVDALRFPNGDRRSQSISQQAVPYLVQQTLTTKSANVVGVSGASYTSRGWRTSLASARLRAGI
jgi:uncharacterized protein with FMN-binding domain